MLSAESVMQRKHTDSDQNGLLEYVLYFASPGADVSAFWAVRLGRLYETGLAPALDIVAIS
jgi:hypothetical protein